MTYHEKQSFMEKKFVPQSERITSSTLDRLRNKTLLGIKSNLEGVVWPPIALGSMATLVALLYQLEETQWLPRERITELQFIQLGALAEHSAKHSPAFRERLQKAGLVTADLTTPQGFRRLPPITRRDIQAAGSALYCAEVPKLHLPIREFRTSGSTGEPVIGLSTSLPYMFWMAMALREYFWHGHDLSERLTVIRATIEKYEERRDWGEPATFLFASGDAQLIPIATDIKEQIRLMRKFQPQHLLVYPSNLAGIIDECQKQQEPIIGIHTIRTISETLSPDLRQKAEKYFNAKVVDVYSSTEMGNMALQCPESGLYHVMAENIILEVLDDNGQECVEGQVGKVVVTDLLNFAMPLVRYSINDYAEAGGVCPCGRGLPTVRRFLGRESNLVVHPDGAKHFPAVGLIRFNEVASVQQFQLIQHDLETVEVRLVAEVALTPAQEEKLRAMIQENLGYPYKIDFVYFDQRLPLQPNGKFAEFICKI